MGRNQSCRTITPEKLRACGASERVIKELQDVGFFCIQHPQFQQTKTEPIKRIKEIRDPEIKGKVISSISKALESGKSPVTGEFTGQKGVTEAEVKKVIAKCAPAPADDPEPETPFPTTNRTEAYIKKLYFQALACPTCIEVRNHKCTMKKECPVCGAKLVSVVMRVDRITEQVTP